MMKIGDKVRFLNEIGGGIVKGFRGKDIVLVEDADGFDIPMPMRECVVIDTDDYNMTRPVPKAAPKKAEEKQVRSSISYPVQEIVKCSTCPNRRYLFTVSRKCVVEIF